MSGNAFDAAVLLIGDGLVAVGRVLGGLRRRCDTEQRADALAVAEESRECWEPDELWVPDGPSAMVWPEPSIYHPSGKFQIHPQVRSAAVSPPAADNTTTVDHLEAAWHYHTGAVGYASMRSGPGGVEWFCEGCNWSGPTKQAHARHRFQVLADTSAATGRVNEQLGGGA